MFFMVLVSFFCFFYLARDDVDWRTSECFVARPSIM